MEPARRRERRADLAAALVDPRALKVEVSVGVPGPDLNGLVDGVGRDDLGSREAAETRPGGAAEGEKREGRVPARARRPEDCVVDVGSALLLLLLLLKSGKLSALGDSGIVSRRGVELPLVGGPHMGGVKPSCAWISRALALNFSQQDDVFQRVTYRFEYSRPPYSCDGDPAPSLAPWAAEASGFDVFPGKRRAPLLGGSTGEVVPVDEPEWGAWEASWGM